MLMSRREISDRILKLLEYDADDIIKEIYNLAYEVKKRPEEAVDDINNILSGITSSLEFTESYDDAYFYIYRSESSLEDDLEELRDAIDEHAEEIAQMEKDLHEHISFDEWSAREYGVESIDYYSTAIKQDKIYQNVEQECSCCGKRFFLKYCSDGTYEYDGHVCDCIATFHPVAGEPTISTWLDQINGRIAVTMKG